MSKYDMLYDYETKACMSSVRSEVCVYSFDEYKVHRYHFDDCINILAEKEKLPVVDYRHGEVLVGYSNGLAGILLSNDDISYGIILLWNPYINKIKIVGKSLSSGVVIGLGFVCNTRDYKVVKLEYDTSRLKVDIYSLISDSWKTISVTNNYVFLKPLSHESNTFVNGCAHWIAKKYQSEEKDWVILCFDTTEEVFREFNIQNLAQDKSLCVTTFGDSIALFTYEGDLQVGVWVMEEYAVANSWSRRPYNVKLPGFCTYFGLMNSGRVILIDGGNTLEYSDPTTGESEKFVIESMKHSELSLFSQSS